MSVHTRGPKVGYQYFKEDSDKQLDDQYRIILGVNRLIPLIPWLWGDLFDVGGRDDNF